VQRRGRAKGLSWFGRLPFEKQCRNTEKDKDRNNGENSYLQVNFTGHETISTEQSERSGVAGLHG
jgi:hypothetical protein